MRHATPLETPSLFTPELMTGSEPIAIVDSADAPALDYARDFVRWCCSFGNDFRNSPDITNLRVWMQKRNISPTPSSEEEVLVEARRLFLKKVEQAVRKPDVPKDKD
jgi:hypothetical protein